MNIILNSMHTYLHMYIRMCIEYEYLSPQWAQNCNLSMSFCPPVKTKKLGATLGPVGWPAKKKPVGIDLLSYDCREKVLGRKCNPGCAILYHQRST